MSDNRLPKIIDPLLHVTAAMALGKIASAKDDLSLACLGFKVSKRSDLENKIARLAVVLARDLTLEHRAEVVREFNLLVQQYDNDFSWTNS